MYIREDKRMKIKGKIIYNIKDSLLLKYITTKKPQGEGFLYKFLNYNFSFPA